MPPSWIVVNLYNQKTTKYHPMMFRYYPLPGEANDVPRYKSYGHHTGGFVFREEALQNCIESEEKLRNMGYTVGSCTEKDFLWDGEDIPANVVLFYEKDGKYEPV